MRMSAACIEPLESRIAPATFVVNSLLDGNPVKDGKLTLREAVLAANTNTAVGDAPAGDALADSITFAPGLAGGTILLTGGLLIGGGGQLSIAGPGGRPGSIVLSAAVNSRVFEIAGAADNVLLSHLTITNGHVTDNGGGIFNQGSLFLDDVLVTKNTAGNGGGIYAEGTASVSIVHSRIEENTVTNSNGGGISYGSVDARLTIRDTTIANNSAPEGAGIYTRTDSVTAISASKIIGNHGTFSGDGAGIFNRGTMTLDETTVSGNIGVGFQFSGGGIRTEGPLTVLNSTISDNLSQGSGGGIYAGDQTLTVINTTIARNSALGVTTGSFSGGGGIFTAAPTTIINSTIVGNFDASTDRAGGIKVTGSVPLLTNTVVAGNFASGASSSGASVDVRGSFSAGSANNFIGVGTGGNIADGNNGNQVGTAASSLDPKLGPLQDNGGRTFTMLPLAGSPLIDAGINSAALSASGAALHSDQRGPGFARVIEINVGGGATVDIGAVEAAGVPDAFGVTSFTYTNTGGTKFSVTLTGGGTFDLLRNTQGTILSRIEIHGTTAASALAVKVLAAPMISNNLQVDGLLADGPLKSITFGKGVNLTGSIGVKGALSSLALEGTDPGSYIRTGGTARQVLTLKPNGNFFAVVDTTSAVGKISMPQASFRGEIRAASIGDITAAGFTGDTNDDAFNSGSGLRQDLIATEGSIGKLTSASTISDYELVTAPGVRGIFRGISLLSKSGSAGVSNTSVTAAEIGPILIAAAGASSYSGIIENSSFTATNGSIAGVAVLLSNPGTSNNTAGIMNSIFTAATVIGNVTITSKDPTLGTITGSDFIAGTKTLATWGNLPTAKLQLAALKNSSLGSISAPGLINHSRFIAAGNIGAVTAPGSFIDSLVLAGAGLGDDRSFGGTGAAADFFVRPVSIGAVTLKEPVNFIIAAGIVPGGAAISDTDVPADAGKIGGTSKIGAIKITATFSTTENFSLHTHTSIVEAGTIASLIVNGKATIPTNGPGILLDTDNSGIDSPGDTLIRLL